MERTFLHLFIFSLFCFLQLEYSKGQVINGFSVASATFNENDSFSSLAISISGVGSSQNVACSLTFSPDVLGFQLILTPLTFSLSSSTPTVNVDFIPLDDNIPCDTVTTTLTLDCGGTTIAGNAVLEVTILDDDADAGACGDPHLIQNVIGHYENKEPVQKSICYDIYGKTGDEFELLNDKELKCSVIFELRDDYYIGRTFFKFPFGQINVTNNEIFLLSGEIISWNNFQNFFKNKYIFQKNLKIEMKRKNSLSIKYENEDKERSFGIIVQRIEKKYGTSYLNVLIDKSTGKNGIFDEKHGGIMGEISNKNYTFYRSVQQNFESEMMKINGKFQKSYVKRSTGSGVSGECHYMNLQDLLYPKNINFFKKSNKN